MSVLNVFKPKPVPAITGMSGRKPEVARPVEMNFRFLPDGQVIWDVENSGEAIKYGFLSNHAIFTIQDWKCRKIASAPPILYEVRDKKEYTKLKALMKNLTPEGMNYVKHVKQKALVEVDNSRIMGIFDQPNPLMNWFEFAYGSSLYKDLVGSSYWQAVRGGSLNDPTVGPIRELYLPQAHHMRILSGGKSNPISKYFLDTNPDVFIDAKNVKQIRNFSPRDETDTQFLYGLSKLHSAREIVLKYNDAVQSEKDIFSKKGIREFVFFKNLADNYQGDMPSIEEMQKVKDSWNRKINENGPGSIIFNPQELGSLKIGFSPQELGILESQKLTKTDLCALYGVADIIFGWSEQSTFNNKAEARKSSLTDAVIPELEAMAEALNTWYLPSYDNTGKYKIGFDYQYFQELQDDYKETVAWMDKAGCLTVNEKRAALNYGEVQDENANKVLVSGSVKLLENLAIDSFPGDPNAIDLNTDENDK